jgi:hypothetical protein
MSLQSDRLALGLREQRGRRIREQWIDSLEAACGFRATPEDFLPLPETDSHKASFFAQIKARAAEQRFLGKVEAHAIRTVTALATRDLPESVVLFSKDDEVLGGLRISPATVLAHAREVWEVIEWDLALATVDLEHGLCLERNQLHEEADGTVSHADIYELTAWGAFALPQ